MVDDRLLVVCYLEAAVRRTLCGLRFSDLYCVLPQLQDRCFNNQSRSRYSEEETLELLSELCWLYREMLPLRLFTGMEVGMLLCCVVLCV